MTQIDKDLFEIIRFPKTIDQIITELKAQGHDKVDAMGVGLYLFKQQDAGKVTKSYETGQRFPLWTATDRS